MAKKKDVCPYKIKEIFKNNVLFDGCITEEDAAVIAEILKPLGNYRIKSALQILDYAKEVLLECTLVHEKYKP